MVGKDRSVAQKYGGVTDLCTRHSTFTLQVLMGTASYDRVSGKSALRRLFANKSSYLCAKPPAQYQASADRAR
jgi:hypothetical protein